MGLQSSSFADFLARTHRPAARPHRTGPGRRRGPGQAIRDLPHATTIVAAACEHGVVLAGDRRATAGSMIAKRDVEKVFRSDEFSAMGYAGTGSMGIEFVRLFQVELEHYEKMEGRSLSLEGKANRLAWMVRGNLGAAMQGLVVVPLFAGYDEEHRDRGRIFSYDVAGGPYEEQRFYSIGSGSLFARGALKKLYVDDMSAGRRGAGLRAGAVRRRRRRLGDRRPRPDQADLPGHRHGHGRRLQEAVRSRVRGLRPAGRPGPDGRAGRPYRPAANRPAALGRPRLIAPGRLAASRHRPAPIRPK
jgi:proteasome beta subunit